MAEEVSLAKKSKAEPKPKAELQPKAHSMVDEMKQARGALSGGGPPPEAEAEAEGGGKESGAE
eukprot:11162314-Lingulodinium_polyedra.AAC.1